MRESQDEPRTGTRARTQAEGNDPVDLDALRTHLDGLGDPPVLDAADTVLPARLRDMLATFTGRRITGGAGSGRPEIDGHHTTLTLTLTCAAQAWPADATAATTVSGVTVTVTADGVVTCTLSGAFDGITVVVTLTADEDDELTAAVRSPDSGAFSLDALVGRLGGDDLRGPVRSGLSDLGLTFGQVAGFDYRLERNPEAEPVTYPVTSVAVAAVLTVGDLTMDIRLWLPDLYVTGGLHEHTPIGIPALLGSFGLPAVDVPAGLDVSELDFTAGLGDIYQVGMTLTGDWQVGPFTLTSLSLEISYDTVEKFVARFAGTVTIGPSITIGVSAAMPTGKGGGWAFEGGILADDAVTVRALTDALHLTGVPKPVESLELTSLWLSHTTGTDRFDFTCRGDLALTDDVTLSIGATVTQDDTGTRYGGTLSIDGFELDLVFDTHSGLDAFAATYSGGSKGATVVPHDWVAAFSAELASMIPDSLRIDLTDAKFVRVKRPDGPACFCVGFDLSADIDLSQLPLVGGFLSSAGTLGVDNLQVLYSSDALDATTAAAVNTLLGGNGVLPLPGAGLQKGLAAVAELRIGTGTTPVALGLPAPAGPPSTPQSWAAPAVLADRPASPGSTSVWVQVQKQLGVLQVNRVGLLYQEHALLFALDAAITLGPLKLSLDGLAVGSPLEKFAPTFSLSGLGLDYSAPSVKISGALLRIVPPPARVAFEYDGAAVVSAEKFSLAAVGSYAQLATGEPSLFVFAQLEVPMGGPPPVEITGLMAGFGFNRELTLPTVREVPGFPFLVLNDQGGQDATQVLDVLEGRRPAVTGDQPRTWVSPRQGSYWLAAGIELTLFEVATSKVVLAAEFGQDLIFALLGTATLRLPLKDESSATYVYAELGLEAALRPTEGTFEVQAQLSPASYVLTPDCHLTGGFAASVWFGDNPNAGQFVITLGGYHPAFDRPSYYPDVPRLGINWAVSSSVSITAGAYLAVTPSCGMAGAALSVVYHSGSFKAWFTAQADLLISWRPFFFTARIAVSIGASYRVDFLFIHKTVSVSVGAELELWGPPTGGSVTAHFLCFSKTISFGAGRGGAQATPLEWSAFSSMLPDRDHMVTVSPVSGLDRTIPDTGDGTGGSGKRWLVRARDLCFVTQSAAPASHLRIGDTPLEPAQPGDGPSIDIRPMNRTGLAGVHRVTVSHDGHPVEDWTLTVRTHNLPASLWGAPPAPFSHTPGAPSADVVPGQPVGYTVQAPRPVLAGSRGVFPLSKYDAEEIPPGLSPLPQHPGLNDDYLCAPDPSALQLLGEAATDPPRTHRDQVYAALADARLYTGDNDSLTGLAAGAGHLYSRPPMIQETGSPR
ncbi:DUF6603 domain-containing protein [Microtetraspora sp. NBRC 13810]|uniref:DUF6603 domain-containing protein n=1 Tax=Microtetraspora sp. NBRC 13810 TaxID=3030990 RepID=UPI00255363A6|nr:DUF6603 domain-containing protein [Microtetraspora sp. NBRC 13810]